MNLKKKTEETLQVRQVVLSSLICRYSLHWQSLFPLPLNRTIMIHLHNEAATLDG